MKKTLRTLFIILAVISMLAALPGAYAESNMIVDRIHDPSIPSSFDEDTPLLHVWFPKIDDCDAALVTYGDFAMLIDCAGEEWQQVDKMLTQLGVTHLNYAFNSHPDTDHFFGFHIILKNIPADEFVTGYQEDWPGLDTITKKVYAGLHEIGVPFYYVQDGDTLEFGDVTVSVARRMPDSNEKTNNYSVCLMIQYGERSIFFTGDIQRDSQLAFAADNDTFPIHADILKAPHHGYNPMTLAFLETVDPSLVIITSGSGSCNLEPQLREHGYHYFYCQYGIMHLSTDGKIWEIERIR